MAKVDDLIILINIMKHWVAVAWEVVNERVAESDAHTASGCRDLTCSPLGVDKSSACETWTSEDQPGRVWLFESTADRSTGIMHLTGPDGAVGST